MQIFLNYLKVKVGVEHLQTSSILSLPKSIYLTSIYFTLVSLADL